MPTLGLLPGLVLGPGVAGMCVHKYVHVQKAPRIYHKVSGSLVVFIQTLPSNTMLGAWPYSPGEDG